MLDDTTREALLEKAEAPAREAIRLHEFYQGKIEIWPKAAIRDITDFAYWYTPGVAEPCLAIAADPTRGYELTGRGNTVAIVSDGSRVLGLGNIGPEGAMPVMEGKAMIFSTSGGVDAVPRPGGRLIRRRPRAVVRRHHPRRSSASSCCRRWGKAMSDRRLTIKGSASGPGRPDCTPPIRPTAACAATTSCRPWTSAGWSRASQRRWVARRSSRGLPGAILTRDELIALAQDRIERAGAVTDPLMSSGSIAPLPDAPHWQIGMIDE